MYGVDWRIINNKIGLFPRPENLFHKILVTGVNEIEDLSACFENNNYQFRDCMFLVFVALGGDV